MARPLRPGSGLRAPALPVVKENQVQRMQNLSQRKESLWLREFVCNMWTMSTVKMIAKFYFKTYRNVTWYKNSLVSLKNLISNLEARLLIKCPQHICNQGGRTWQPFVGSKSGNENFCQARINNFRVKCVVFARNRKFAELTQ